MTIDPEHRTNLRPAKSEQLNAKPARLHVRAELL